MVRKKKGPKVSGGASKSQAPSDVTSVVSDMSYQSDLSEAVSKNGAFITA